MPTIHPSPSSRRQPRPPGHPRPAGRAQRGRDARPGHSARPGGGAQPDQGARPRRRVPVFCRFLLVAGAAAALLGVPAAVQAAVFPAHAAAPARAAAPLAPGAAQVPERPLAPSGGICSVPGIGDIGGLLGFCAAGSSGIIGDINNICQPSVPTPEAATGGIDALISPAPGTVNSKQPATLYDQYGMAGQSWAAFDLQCSDMASLVGNNIAGVVFDAAKAMDRVTITVYQSAAGNGILSWLTVAVDRLVSSLGRAIYFPYLAPVVILGAIWLAWQGLIRKRASRTVEGTIWMVVACAAAIWLIGQPQDFTGAGKAVSDGITQALNVAFAKLPAPHSSSCVPLGTKDPQSTPLANYSYTSGNNIVDTNANELWTVLVCKPWLDGEFGTTGYATGKGAATVVNTYGRQLLWAQAIAANEKATANVIQAKENAYQGLASSLKQKDPGVYPLFQGKQWTTRLEIAFTALFAALLAGVLVLLIAITLILLKLGFLLLLVAGPFFLIVGTHPGFGRVIALRWGELLIGVLLKQAAIAIVLSVLLYAYSLIMGTSDTVLPWGLKILMISLVTVAVFIYRKPFTHLFSAVGYGVIGSRDAADTQLARATSSGARNTIDAATLAVPGFAAYRAARWARRNPAQAAGLAAQVATAGAAAGAAGAAAAAANGASGAPADSGAAEAGPDGAQPGAGAGGRVAARGLARSGADAAAAGRTPPPLDLPSRADESAPRPSSGWARTGTNGSLTSQPRSQWPGTAPRSGAGGASPRPAPTGPAGPLAGGGHRPAPRQAPPAPPRGAPPPPRSAPPARRAAPPAAAPRASAPRHTAPRHPAAPPPRVAPGDPNGSARSAPGPLAGSSGDPASRSPFWLRPLRRRK
jgi:hypothetical protein